MKTVKEFRDLGVPFVKGDKYIHSGEEVEMLVDNITIGWFERGTVSALAAIITSFAWRPLSTLPDNPKFKYELDYSKAEIKWRPLLDQSKAACSFDGVMEKLSADRSLLTEFKHYEDDEMATQKPVFTQAMADAGELPPVGSEVTIKYRYGNAFENVVIKYASKDVLVYTTKELFERYGAMECIEYIRPIDTRTPKQKAVDEIVRMLHSEGVVAFDPIMLHIMYEKGFIKQ